MTPSKKTTLLCILDGFGLNPNPLGNAIALAKKPNFDALWAGSPHTTLVTFGERVGLPEGQMGNSEVGHLNIGAGRVVEQWLLRISQALKKNALAKSPAYQKFLASVKDSPAVHLVGLFSDGGVHSHSEHATLLVERIAQDFKGKVVVHIITDGRDTSPHRALDQLPELIATIKKYPSVSVGTVSGRFFAMDRDKRWERIEKAYNAIALGKGEAASDLLAYISGSYEKKITDEFIEPAVVSKNSIGEKDGIIFWNFREDRMREIVKALCVKEFEGFARSAPVFTAERVLGFTEYDHTFHLPFLFEPIDIKNHIGEVIAERGLTQLRVAETEKYPHVTYFFNGGIEKAYAGEEHTVLPSPRDVKTYDLKPEMSAEAVCQTVVTGLESGKFDFIAVNFANCDMVGHTGVVSAAVKAVETVDACLGKILAALKKNGGQAVVLADHGNADQMINYTDNSPHTAHTLHPVPFIAVGNEGVKKLADGGALCDVAPTVLKMMGISQPKEMSGKALF